MSENTNECVIEWIPGRYYVGLTSKNGSTWKNRCEELEMDSLIATEHPGVSRAYRLTEYRYERKKYGKQIKDESTKEK
jgi:hypothetical protein|nr:MAG TPA: hypothetical protein [Bacteriophage sp.]